MGTLARRLNSSSLILDESCCRWNPCRGCSRAFSHSWFRSVSLAKLQVRSKLVVPCLSTTDQSVPSPSPSPSPSLSAELDVDTETEDLQIQSSTEMNTVHVVFKLQKSCLFGEHFFLVGEDPRFGLWDPSRAIPLAWSGGHIWSTEMDIPVGKAILFKFILKGSTGKVEWQPGPDRILETWETRKTIVVSEDWQDAELQKITEVILPDYTEFSEDWENAELQKVAEDPDETESDSTEAILVKMNCADTIENEEIVTLEEVENPIIIREEQPVLVPGLAPASHLAIKESLLEEVVEREANTPLTSDEPIEGSIPKKEGQLHEEKQPEQSYGYMPEDKPDQDCTVLTVTEASDSLEKVQSTQKAAHRDPADDGVFQNDIDWGRKSMLQFILSLGFQNKLLS